MHNEISALAGEVEKDRVYLLKRQVANCEHMFVALQKVLSGQRMKSKNRKYENTKLTLDVSTYI